LPAVLSGDAQLALLGNGDPPLEHGFDAAAKSNPNQIGVLIGYDESLAHLIQAGADALVVPSRYEPCGLTQLCALRYGAIPIVSRVGGLADTVIDADDPAPTSNAPTGVKFGPVARENLADAVSRAKILFHDKDGWRTMQSNGMATDVSWHNSARQYATLYRQIVNLRRH
jgi:starch synthase